MNSDTPFTTIGDEPVEARIVAWVLGEASAFEAAELERLCQERPELLVFRRRMRALHGLLTEAESALPDDSWKLPEAKRRALDGICGETVEPSKDPVIERRIRRSGRRALLAIAACLILTVVVAGFVGGGASIQKARKMANQREIPTIVTYSASVMEDDFRGEQDESAAPAPERARSLPEAPSSMVDRISENGKTADATEGVIVGGQVRTPGQVAFRNEMTLQDAVQSAGGANEFGSSKRVKVVRDGDAKSYDLSKSESRTLKLQPGDIVEMPQKNWLGRDGGSASSTASNERMNADSAKSVPVPEVNLPIPSMDFGDASEFGKGWGGRDVAAGAASVESGGFRFDPARAAADSAPPDDQLAMAGSASAISPASRGGLKRDLTESGKMPVLGNPAEGNRFANDPGVAEEIKPPVITTRSDSKDDPIRTHPSGTVELKRESDNSIEMPVDFDGFANFGKPMAERTVAEPEFAAAPADSSWDTSTPALDAKSAASGGEYEIQPGYSSEYFFRGIDLSGEGSDDKQGIQPPAPAQPAVGSEFQHITEYEPPVLADAEKELDVEQQPLEQMELKLAANAKAKPAPSKPDFTKLMEEISAAEDPYSTFSLNISDASFQIAMAALEKGEQPDPAGIKVEQFYNAVDYGDPAPAAGEPVAVSIEQAAHPIIPGRNLVRVALKTAAAGRSAAQPLRLTLLVDQSGSMVREDRRAAMDKALGGLADLLTDKDLVTVIGFSRTPRLLADGMPGNQAGKLAGLVNQAASEGGTNLEQAIELAGRLADKRMLEGAQNRIVLFTDGAANLGNADPERLAEKVKQLRLKGIAFDIAGIAAEDLNDGLLGELARNGNGRYYVVGKGADDTFAKQLAGAFRPAAENVKVQVRFNPERVGRYKLIGFEKDRLKTEDFRNDAVDAAELAAEEAGVAIYQVEILPDGRGEIGEVGVRFRDTAADEMFERSWTIPHDRATPAIDRAPPSMQLAVLAMLAAEKLKGGPMAEAIDFNQLAGPAAEVKRFFGEAGRVGEVQRMVNSLK